MTLCQQLVASTCSREWHTHLHLPSLHVSSPSGHANTMATTSTLTTFDTGHMDMVHDIQFDYYGRRVASCSSDRTIKIFDVAGGQPRQLADLIGHEGPVWAVSWGHPKFGTLLASCSYDHRVIVWKETQEAVWTQVGLQLHMKGDPSASKLCPTHRYTGARYTQQASTALRGLPMSSGLCSPAPLQTALYPSSRTSQTVAGTLTRYCEPRHMSRHTAPTLCAVLLHHHQQQHHPHHQHPPLCIMHTPAALSAGGCARPWLHGRLMVPSNAQGLLGQRHPSEPAPAPIRIRRLRQRHQSLAAQPTYQ